MVFFYHLVHIFISLFYKITFTISNMLLLTFVSRLSQLRHSVDIVGLIIVSNCQNVIGQLISYSVVLFFETRFTDFKKTFSSLENVS